MGARTRIVVLDDDPTGIQTVHGCYLVTNWNPETLRVALDDEQGFFYVLTNTRAYGRERAARIVEEVATNVLRLNETCRYNLLFISRSDSTLRNHFPTEVNAILGRIESDGRAADAVFLVPAFLECGRVTAGDTHYLVEGGRRIPTAETEFAKDSVFGYGTSFLPKYIEEKTRGAVRAEAVRSIPLAMLRAADAGPLRAFLGGLRERAYVVVNAEEYADLQRFAAAVHEAAAAGKRFVFQSAASLVKALSGIADKALLGREILGGTGPGLFVAGSHVGRTSAQLARLLEAPAVEGVEVDVREVLARGEAALAPVLARVGAIWNGGRTPVVFTSRTELRFDSKEERLTAGEVIAEFLVNVVRGLRVRPSYLVAKGGITSHTILVRGLEVDRVRVLGQVLAGVPAIVTPEGSRFPRMPYVIFPGNVGDENALRRVYEILGAPAAEMAGPMNV